MNAPRNMTETSTEACEAEAKNLTARNVKLSERNLQLAEMVADLQGVIEDLKMEIREVVTERNALRRTAPARLLKRAVIEYRELVEEGETNKYVWMGVESHLDRALEQIRV